MEIFALITFSLKLIVSHFKFDRHKVFLWKMFDRTVSYELTLK